MDEERSLRKAIWYYVMSRKGQDIQEGEATKTLEVENLQGKNKPYIALIKGVGGKYGLKREFQNHKVDVDIFSSGDVLEVRHSTGSSQERVFYVVEDGAFHPFVAIWGSLKLGKPHVIVSKGPIEVEGERRTQECPFCEKMTEFIEKTVVDKKKNQALIIRWECSECGMEYYIWSIYDDEDFAADYVIDDDIADLPP